MFKHRGTGEYTVIHNDNDAIWQFLREQPLLCGFNNKAYDNFILKAVAADCTPQEVKALSEYLIDGGQGWQHPLMRGNPVFVTSFDIRDDMYEGLSLKACEGHLGMSVVESSVPFVESVTYLAVTLFVFSSQWRTGRNDFLLQARC